MLTSEIERQNEMMGTKANEWESFKGNYLQMEIQLQRYAKFEQDYKQLQMFLEESRKKIQILEQ